MIKHFVALDEMFKMITGEGKSSVDFICERMLSRAC